MASPRTDVNGPDDERRPETPPQAADRAPRRRGRPQGPPREMLSVRILAENDRRLGQAVKMTGKNPQTLVDEALALLFARLGMRDGPQGSPRR